MLQEPRIEEDEVVKGRVALEPTARRSVGSGRAAFNWSVVLEVVLGDPLEVVELRLSKVRDGTTMTRKRCLKGVSKVNGCRSLKVL